MSAILDGIPRIAGKPPGTVRVLICDDSAVVRVLLERALTDDPMIEVVAKASNGQQAIVAVQAGGIDVVVLDIEMPVMDGITALPRLLEADRDVKVLISSALTTQGAAIALEALRLGAADFMAKPTASAGPGGDKTFQDEMVAKVLGLGRQVHNRRRGRSAPTVAVTGVAPPTNFPLSPAPVHRPAILAVGSSTGGPAALLSFFQALSPPGASHSALPAIPIIVTQHMPAAFTTQLAQHIDRLCGCSCAEAIHGEPLRPGHIHLAPGDRHLLVRRRDGVPCVMLSDDPPENFCRPAVDPMLRSLVPVFGGRVLVLMLTGMGQDGLVGSSAVVAAGGGVLAQDEASSVVWGMPGAVARAGLCHAVLPLQQLAPRILAAIGKREGA